MKTRAVPDNYPTAEGQVKEDLDRLEEVMMEDLDEEVSGPIKLEPIVFRVQRQYKESGDLVIDPEEETEEIEVQGFHVEPAHATLQVSHTLNMGQYWSTTVRVGMDVPCYREEYEKAFEFVVKTITERLAGEIVKAKERTEELRGRRGPGSDLF